MGTARKMLDFSFDFLLFVAACIFIIGGFAHFTTMQRALHTNISDKGILGVEEQVSSLADGEEIIALLQYPEGIDYVIIDGAAGSNDFTSCIGSVSCDLSYMISRHTDPDGNNVLSLTTVNP